ncbi:MAG: amino acid permease [Proteobacteria bacterium]|nr:amino acid permease [Pseudomonadota bacterium]
MEFKVNKNKPLGVFSLVMINVIAIDSIRNLPANAANGYSLALLYLVASLLFLLPTILVTAELATHYPKTGGVYIWMREAFGSQWGLFTIWFQWVYNVFWYPTILSFIATNVAYLINPALASQKLFIVPMIMGMFLIATAVNARGMKMSSLVSTACAIGGTLIPMVAIMVLAAGWMLTGKPLAVNPTMEHWVPRLNQMPNIAFLVIILFSLMGFEMSAVHAEAVKNPQRDFPKALLYSGILIVLTMVLSSLAIVMVTPAKTLNIISGINDAFKIFLDTFHLGWLMPALILMMVIGGFGGMAAWVIGPTKGLVVAAEDGLLPAFLSVRNAKGSPARLLWLQAVITLILSCIFLCFKSMSTSYWILSVLTSQLALVFYICLFAAAIKIRYKNQTVANAYRIPGGFIGMWVVAGIGIITCLAAIIIGFVPPADVPISNLALYETMLLIGMIVFIGFPFIIRKKFNLNASPTV